MREARSAARHRGLASMGRDAAALTIAWSSAGRPESRERWSTLPDSRRLERQIDDDIEHYRVSA
jgi:hypothetical protein